MDDTYSPPLTHNPKSQTDLMVPSNDVAKNDYDDFLVSDVLFVGELPSSIRETDIKTLLQHCMPVEIYIKREDDLVKDDEDSFLRFISPKYADRAYTLYHGFKFTNGATLQLRMYRDPTLEPEALGDVLEVSNLAPETDDIHRLYDLFRPFGPLHLCISTGQGTAVIQYFKHADSKEAIHQTDGMILDGTRITITQLIMEKNDTATPYLTSPPLSSSQPNNFHERQQAQHQHQHKQQQQHTLTSTSKSHIDLMNLYVKNMDPLITNEHLEELFGKFGRIISARVISHPTTKQSRGYGFVSFSREDEAAHALNEMNGQVVFSKPLYVSYHEPKKGRNDNNNSNNNNNNNSNNNNNYGLENAGYHQTLSKQPSQPNMNGMGKSHPMGRNDMELSSSYQQQQYYEYNASPVVNLPRKQSPVLDYAHPSTVMIEEMNPFKDNATVKLPPKRSPAGVAEVPCSNPIPIVSNPGGPTLVSLATGLSIESAPHLSNYQNVPQHLMEPAPRHGNKDYTATAISPRPMRRRASIESMASAMTDTTTSMQRQRLTDAVTRSGCCGNDERIPEVVDLLLSLTRKERTLCLFNTDFLRKKVDLALDSLDTFNDDDDGDDIIDINSMDGDGPETQWAQQQQQLRLSYATANALPHTYKAATPAHSSFVASEKRTIGPHHNNDTRLPLTPPSSSLSNSELTSGRMSPAEIDALLKSIASMSLHTQKQKLGDIMWNHVKPLAKPLAKAHKVPGFSSKVLVHLLDNVPLCELAHGINDTPWLTMQVEKAADTIHKS
ncbi:hypothetical protein BCR42DRAFT_401489 [Absidia repens]|uniref:RRM domain-containing protein n=1 Tax=Absidia repens TaxID=90262 RepID=A0A1X2J2J4_9FUNG|nr:hypothetical protein BCR42DRAFT_401489 [Absidia repens]